jgi:two-component system, NtrC family, sensor histidine kinase PilS
VSSVRRALRLMTTIRLVVVSTIVLSAIVIQATAGLVLPLSGLYAIAAAAFALSALSMTTRRVVSPEALARWQLIGDLLLVTALVYVSGGAESVFSFLYLLVIAAAAFLLSPPGGVVVASAAAILYGVLIEFCAYGLLPPPPLAQATDWSGPRLVFHLGVHIAGFYGVAVLASLMAHKLASAREEIEARRGEIEKMRALHADVIDSMSSGLATVDTAGRVTFLNRAGSEILNVAESQAAGRRIWEIGPLTERDWKGIREAVARGESPRGETEIFREEAPRIVGYSARRLRGAPGALLLFQDLTEMKKLEYEARAQEKLAAVGSLAAGIAHEIRNPLASISGSAQMLSNEMNRGSSEKRLVEIIVSESRRLSTILEEFLRYARPSRSRMKTFDIAASLAEAMDLFCHSDEVADHHRLHLEIDPSRSELTADPDQIKQIFWNVAKNAVRAMPEGGILHVEGHEDGFWYTIVFRDTGKGMTQEERDRLFQPFASDFDGGTGLGMAIVRRLIDEHGGRIAVDSSVGSGTRIELRLPREIAKSSAA